ncbi:MAG: hypothetical protein MJK04_02030 [Psychrosphaera sp.]|nr:hypothetical protein [Psychrosphaera sp.]
MKYLKKIVLIAVLINVTGCTVFLGEPDQRVTGFNNVELCTELADKTFKYHAAWSWAISDEVKKRGFDKGDKGDRCKSIYETRMQRIMRKVHAQPVSFEDALTSKTTK